MGGCARAEHRRRVVAVRVDGEAVDPDADGPPQCVLYPVVGTADRVHHVRNAPSRGLACVLTVGTGGSHNPSKLARYADRVGGVRVESRVGRRGERHGSRREAAGSSQGRAGRGWNPVAVDRAHRGGKPYGGIGNNVDTGQNVVVRVGAGSELLGQPVGTAYASHSRFLDVADQRVLRLGGRRQGHGGEQQQGEGRPGAQRAGREAAAPGGRRARGLPRTPVRGRAPLAPPPGRPRTSDGGKGNGRAGTARQGQD